MSNKSPRLANFTRRSRSYLRPPQSQKQVVEFPTGPDVLMAFFTTLSLKYGLSYTLDRLNHSIDIAEGIGIGLIVALRIVLGARHVVGIDAIGVAGVF